MSYAYFSGAASCQKFDSAVAFWFIAGAFSMSEKKEVRELPDAPKVSVPATRLNVNTPYRVIEDLSAPRRRVNQTEDDRPAFLELQVSLFRSLGRRSCRHIKTSRVFYWYLLPRKTSFNSPSLLPPPLTFHARKPREPRKHVNSIKTLYRLFLSCPKRASLYLLSCLLGHNGNFFFFLFF